MSLRRSLLVAALSCCLPSALPAEESLRFDVRLLTVDGNEGIAAGDVDGDGKLDIVAGRNWFRGGEWAPRPLRNIDDWNGYVQSNGDYLFDVDADGRLDVIAGSFLPTQVHWYRNPGDEGLRLGKQWTQNLLVDTGASANEGQLLDDLDGDGNLEWIANSWKPTNPLAVWSLMPKSEETAAVSEKTKAKKGDQPAPTAIDVKRRLIGENANGHGIATGDLNGDGRTDVLVGNGWYEQPAENPWDAPWTYHADWNLHASLPMIVTDLDRDGDSDLIYGNGHDFGLQWWENLGVEESGPEESGVEESGVEESTGKIRWEKHLIDRSYSQPHTLAWKDLDGDGNADLITGKRYYAHNGNDPGGKDVPCLYWYSWDQDTKSFTRHTIDEGRVGTGLQIVVEDFNGDGSQDIAVAGKSGTYLLTAQP